MGELLKGVQVNCQILIDKLIRHGANESSDGRSFQELTLTELESEWRYHWEMGG